MAGIPKVRIQFDADFDELKKGVKGATNEVESFGDRVGDFAKKAGAAFAIAGAAAAAYAGKLLIDGVKSAIEDEAAQAKLAATLQNLTGATDSQIKATENYILKTQLAFGVTDQELRPSLERLLRATKDVEEAQKLQTLALDISAGSGKSLEAVSNALGRAYEGNTGALGRLGVGLSTAELKSMSLDEVTKTLADTFGGQASEQADTFQGKMDKLKVAFDESKESVGAALLPILEQMATFITTNIVPAINSFVAGLTGADDASLTSGLTKSQETALEWGKRIKGLVGTIITFKDELILLGKVLAAVFLVSAIAGWVSATIAGITTIIKFYNALKASAIVAGIASAFALNPLLGVGATALAAAVLAGAVVLSNKFNTPIPEARATGGSVSSGTPYIVGEKGAELFVPQVNGMIVPNNAMGSSSQVININVSGAIDPIRTARTIADLLGREGTTNGSFNNLGLSRIVATS
jgi:hypothetical protein